VRANGRTYEYESSACARVTSTDDMTNDPDFYSFDNGFLGRHRHPRIINELRC